MCVCVCVCTSSILIVDRNSGSRSHSLLKCNIYPKRVIVFNFLQIKRIILLIEFKESATYITEQINTLLIAS